MIKILIADDHQLFIDGLSSLMKNEPEIEISGQALNGAEVLSVLASKSIDIILLDINMPDTDIVALTKEIREKYPNLKVIILTMYHGTRYYTKLLKYGIHGYLYKSEGKEVFLTAIKMASQGEMYISKELFSSGAKNTKDLMPAFSLKSSSIENVLTKRELEILKLIVQECSNNTIAEKLFISTGTVDTHRKNIILKLGVKNTVGLIKYCIQNNLID
ncbi:MAG: response regulator transcription factor [Sporocytophaga sp.]|jgi:DNA-binding NarL/FixJ family response regulator|nr:response regulator transcription factor [Sporocytophaga sp.]